MYACDIAKAKLQSVKYSKMLQLLILALWVRQLRHV